MADHASKRAGATVLMHPTREATAVGAVERAIDFLATPDGAKTQNATVLLYLGHGHYRVFHDEKSCETLLWESRVLEKYAFEDE